MQNFNDEIMERMIGDSYEKKERKKKLHDLLDKYDGNIKALEDAVGADGWDYMFAKKYLDEVLDERGTKRNQETSPVYREHKEEAADRLRDDVKKRREETVEKVVKKRSKEDDESLLISLLPHSIRKAKKAADRLQKANLLDDNKHQYVSCVGAQGGVPEASLMLGAGVYKELKDLYGKLPSAEQRKAYKGVLGILKDSAKDLKNDLYGLGYGLTYRNEGDCDILLKKKIK